MDVGPGQVVYIPKGWVFEVRNYGYKPDDWKGVDDDNAKGVEDESEKGVYMSLNWRYAPPSENATFLTPYNEGEMILSEAATLVANNACTK